MSVVLVARSRHVTNLGLFVAAGSLNLRRVLHQDGKEGDPLPPSSGRVSSTRLQSDLHPGPGRADRLPGGRGLSLQVRSTE